MSPPPPPDSASNCTLRSPEIYMDFNARLIGSCNGLLCVYDSDAVAVRVVNPVIRNSITLPTPSMESEDIIHPSFGFGYHPRTDAYTVVFFPSDTAKPPMAYTLGKDTEWRSLVPSAPRAEMRFQQRACIAGRMLWVEEGDPRSIVVLDLATECFGSMEYPPSAPRVNKFNHRIEFDREGTLVEIDGELNMVFIRQNKIDGYGVRVELWAWLDGGGGTRRWSHWRTLQINLAEDCSDEAVRLMSDMFGVHGGKLWYLQPTTGRLYSYRIGSGARTDDGTEAVKWEYADEVRLGIRRSRDMRVCCQHQETLISPSSLLMAPSRSQTQGSTADCDFSYRPAS